MTDTNTAPEREPECKTNLWLCEWEQSYYGWKCKNCGEFIPFGSEPWMPHDDDGIGYDDE